MHGKAESARLGATPQEPTPALPGSEEKIRVLTERASRREQLFHPMDGLVDPANSKPAPLVDAPYWLSRLAAFQLLAFVPDDFDDEFDDEPLNQDEGTQPPIKPTSKAS